MLQINLYLSPCGLTSSLRVFSSECSAKRKCSVAIVFKLLFRVCHQKLFIESEELDQNGTRHLLLWLVT